METSAERDSGPKAAVIFTDDAASAAQMWAKGPAS
jgi:hypothetical protein